MQFNPPWKQQPPAAVAGMIRPPGVNGPSPEDASAAGGIPGGVISPMPMAAAAPSSYHTGNFMPQSQRTFSQPHLAMYHTGMNGFPMVPTATNGSLLSSLAMPQVRVPFASCITMYQFPSPKPVYAWSSPGSENAAQSALLSLQTSYENRPSVMSTNENSAAGSMISHGNYSTVNHMNVMNGTGLSKGCGKYPKRSSGAYARAFLHSKRKVPDPLDMLEESGPPPKVFINEERMSACLRDMNLDNNNLGWHPDLEEQPWYSPNPANNNNNDELQDTTQPSDSSTSSDEDKVEDIENCDQSLPRLQLLSKDLKLRINTKTLLPKVILDELAKPQLQVVLWKPPGDCIKETIQQANTDSPASPVLLSRQESPGVSTCGPQSDAGSMEGVLEMDDKPPMFNLPFTSEASALQPSEPTLVGLNPPSSMNGMLQDDDCMDL